MKNFDADNKIVEDGEMFMPYKKGIIARDLAPSAKIFRPAKIYLKKKK
jgi:hypothetical protein